MTTAPDSLRAIPALLLKCLIPCMLCSATALAQVWVGGGATNGWEANDNWDATPDFDGTDDITIGNFSTALNADRFINSLTGGGGGNSWINAGVSGSTLTIKSGNVTQSGSGRINAQVVLGDPNVTSGDFTANFSGPSAGALQFGSGAAGAAGPGLSRADPGQSWTVVTSGNVNMRGGVWDVDHVQITSGRLRMENSAEFAGGVNTTMQIDSGAELSWGNPNQPITVAALTGGGEVVSRQSGEWTFRVNAGEDHTFEGRITQQESARRTALTLDGSATWTLTGNDHDYTGITNIDGGTLRMNGIVLEGTDADVTDKSWHVNDGGGLGGIGEIRRDVFVNEGGTLRPGNSTGVLTLGDSSVGSGLSVNLTLEDGFLYEWEYDNGMADRDLVHVIGNLVLDGDHFTSGAGASVITLMNLGTGSLQIGDILFSTTEGILDGATPVTSGTLNWDVQDGSGFFAAVDGNNIVLVPEPGTLALLVIALGASFIASRRRK